LASEGPENVDTKLRVEIHGISQVRYVKIFDSVISSIIVVLAEFPFA